MARGTSFSSGTVEYAILLLLTEADFNDKPISFCTCHLTWDIFPPPPIPPPPPPPPPPTHTHTHTHTHHLPPHTDALPDNKIHGVNMGPIWGRQDPGGPHVGHMNFAIWELVHLMHFCGHHVCHQRFTSTLTQVKACCLTTRSHYLNQCWFII